MRTRKPSLQPLKGLKCQRNILLVRKSRHEQKHRSIMGYTKFVPYSEASPAVDAPEHLKIYHCRHHADRGADTLIAQLRRNRFGGHDYRIGRICVRLRELARKLRGQTLSERRVMCVAIEQCVVRVNERHTKTTACVVRRHPSSNKQRMTVNDIALTQETCFVATRNEWKR